MNNFYTIQIICNCCEEATSVVLDQEDLEHYENLGKLFDLDYICPICYEKILNRALEQTKNGLEKSE